MTVSRIDAEKIAYVLVEGMPYIQRFSNKRISNDKKKIFRRGKLLFFRNFWKNYYQ